MMTTESRIEFLQRLVAIRRFEENIARIYSRELIRCPVHLAVGHEAVAVGTCMNLQREDLVFSYHRSHHHYLAKGGSEQRLLWELLGDTRGCSGGRGGSTHLTDRSVGFVASTAIISGTIPVASGMAHALKLNSSSNICVVFCGDAAAEEGVFFETLNMAKLWKLPLLFVIEDNDLSCYTDKSTRQSFAGFTQLAKLFDIESADVDGSDAAAVFAAARDAVRYVREQSQPYLLHTRVYRALEHCGPDKDDLLSYRKNSELWPALDPIEKMKGSFASEDFSKIRETVERRIDRLFESSVAEEVK